MIEKKRNSRLSFVARLEVSSVLRCSSVSSIKTRERRRERNCKKAKRRR